MRPKRGKKWSLATQLKKRRFLRKKTKAGPIKKASAGG